MFLWIVPKPTTLISYLLQFGRRFVDICFKTPLNTYNLCVSAQINLKYIIVTYRHADHSPIQVIRPPTWWENNTNCHSPQNRQCSHNSIQRAYNKKSSSSVLVRLSDRIIKSRSYDVTLGYGLAYKQARDQHEYKSIRRNEASRYYFQP